MFTIYAVILIMNVHYYEQFCICISGVCFTIIVKSNYFNYVYHYFARYFNSNEACNNYRKHKFIYIRNDFRNSRGFDFIALISVFFFINLSSKIYIHVERNYTYTHIYIYIWLLSVVLDLRLKVPSNINSTEVSLQMIVNAFLTLNARSSLIDANSKQCYLCNDKIITFYL